MANDFALRLNRAGLAEMSCIAGIGGQIAPLVRLARQNRPILALDGCALHCVQACLAQIGVQATTCIDLGRLGVRKQKHGDYCRDEAERLWSAVILPAMQRLATENAT